MIRQIFVCYAHQDTRLALKLARYLQQLGLPVWLDQWHTPAHAEWEQAVGRALRRCTHVLLVWSPEAADSWVVRDQMLLAHQLGKPVLVAQLRPASLPHILAEAPVADFTGGPRRFWQGVSHLAGVVGRPVPGGWLQRLRLGWAVTDSQAVYRGALIAAVVLGLLLVGWVVVTAWPAAIETEPVVLAFEPAGAVTPVVIPTADSPLLPNPQPTPLGTNIRPTDGKVQVLVPAGDFLMGAAAADPLADTDEMPQQVVYLDAFWIDKTEITNAQYQSCLAANACTPSSVHFRDFTEPLQPVVGVNWEQAQQYCRWVGARLPTEAEWEKAARGVDGRRFPWGNQFDGTRLNYCDRNCIADWRDNSASDGYAKTAPVGAFLQGASPYGALDMSGNVWEWTADWYAPDAYLRQPYRNPTGPAAGQQRVIRGGSWLYLENSVRVTRRHKELPTYSYENIGFRCVMPAAQK